MKKMNNRLNCLNRHTYIHLKKVKEIPSVFVGLIKTCQFRRLRQLCVILQFSHKGGLKWVRNAVYVSMIAG